MTKNDNKEAPWVEWEKEDSIEQFAYKNSDKLLPAFINRTKSIYNSIINFVSFWKS
jgi:hypothetical protein